MAGVGSLGSTQREGQQLAGIFTFPAIIPMMLSGFVFMSPNHILFRVLSIFPLTSPIAVMQRLAATDLPWWEIALSLAVLAASVVLAMIAAAKVFRVGLLMYGKRPSLRLIMRLVREA
jgi:ABC-2 type transport system permease protein